MLLPCCLEFAIFGQALQEEGGRCLPGAVVGVQRSDGVDIDAGAGEVRPVFLPSLSGEPKVAGLVGEECGGVFHQKNLSLFRHCSRSGGHTLTRRGGIPHGATVTSLLCTEVTK